MKKGAIALFSAVAVMTLNSAAGTAGGCDTGVQNIVTDCDPTVSGYCESATETYSICSGDRVTIKGDCTHHGTTGSNFLMSYNYSIMECTKATTDPNTGIKSTTCTNVGSSFLPYSLNVSLNCRA